MAPPVHRFGRVSLIVLEAYPAQFERRDYLRLSKTIDLNLLAGRVPRW